MARAGRGAPPDGGQGDDPVAQGRSRLQDALAFLPLLGFLIFSVPLIWGGMEIGTATALIYLFWGWFGLCVLTALLSSLASRRMPAEDPGADDPGSRAPGP